MRRITMLTVAALAVGGCNFPVAIGPMCWDGCGSSLPSAGTDVAVIGFPWAKLDTTGGGGPGTAARARLALGDSVTLHFVLLEPGANPCTAGDTVRVVRLLVSDSTVLRSRPDTTGRATITAVGKGTSAVWGTMGERTSGSIIACNGASSRWADAITVE